MSIYKSEEAKQQILSLYDKKLNSLNISYEEIDITTSFGQTRVVKTGNETGKRIVLFHGINAGSPITIEPIKELTNDYLIYSVDTIGQTTKSAETSINIADHSYGKWANEVLEGLSLEQTNCVGISYGAYILQKLIAYHPNRVAKCVMIVPAGLVNGTFVPSMKKLMIPLFKFRITKKEQHLKTFLNAFVPADDDHMIELQRIMLDGVKLDHRRPTLLKKEDVAKYKHPVFLIVADNDVFFPGLQAIEKAKKVFTNLKEFHILKNSKHIPHKGLFPEIQSKLREWI